MTEYTRENMPDDLRWLATRYEVWPHPVRYIVPCECPAGGFVPAYNCGTYYGNSYDERQWKSARQTLGLDRNLYEEIKEGFDSMAVTEEEERAWAEKYGNPVQEADMVNHPPHYQSDNGIECIDAIRAALGKEGFIAYCRGNVIKYSWRLKSNPAEDQGKAAWYANKAKEALEE